MRTLICLAIAPILLATGCKGPGILTSLDDLTAHVDRQGLLDLQQQRVLSLSGLIPDAPPGSVYRYHGDRSPFTAVGISLWDGTERFAGLPADTAVAGGGDRETTSFLIRRTIETQKSLSELVAIRDALIDVRTKGASLIRLRLDRLVAMQRANDLAARADKDGVTDAQLTRLGEEQKSQAEMVTSIQSAVATAETEFNATLKASQAALDAPGLMVLRAETKESSSFGARLGAIFGADGSQSDEKTGFAILAGLRTTRIFVGQDLAAEFRRIPSDWTLIGRKFPFILGVRWVNWVPFIKHFPIVYPGQLSKDNFYVTTSRLEAQYILYAQDSLSEQQVKANFEASTDALGDLGSIASSEQAELDLILSSVASLGSTGILGEVVEKAQTLQDYRTKSETEREPDALGWTTVYAVMTELADLEVLLSGHPRPHLTGWF